MLRSLVGSEMCIRDRSHSADLEKSVGVRLEFDLVAAVRPRAEDERALLLVEREVLDVDRARALVDGARNPHHSSVGIDQNVRLEGYFEPSVGTAAHQIVSRTANAPFDVNSTLRNNTITMGLFSRN